jgi:hypothetical protein
MEKDSGLLKSIFVGHFIIILHILLIAAIGLLVLFFSGIVAYMGWIFLGATAAIAAGGYCLYRRMKAEGRTLREMLGSPMFRGRSVEISVLGGLASLKIGNPETSGRVIDLEPPRMQLEDPADIKVRELSELANLLEKNLVTLEEYNTLKDRLFKS